MKEKFKIGDHVRIIHNTANSNNKIGDIGILTSMMTKGGCVEVPNGSTYANHQYFTDLELVQKEFTLPKKWCIKASNNEECEVIAKWCNENKIDDESTYYVVPTLRYIHSEKIKDHTPYYVRWTANGGSNYIEPGFTIITFDQFVEHVVNAKKFEALPQYQITAYVNINNVDDIKQVTNNEGSTFELSDEICAIKPSIILPNSAKIIRFRYNKAKTDICAVFSEKYPNGISISKLQHFIKPKVIIPVNETNQEKALRLYTNGTKVRSTVGTIGISNGEISFISREGDIYMSRIRSESSLCVYSRSQNLWADIIND